MRRAVEEEDEEEEEGVPALNDEDPESEAEIVALVCNCPYCTHQEGSKTPDECGGLIRR